MKLKMITCLTLATILGSNVYALQISKGKLIAHKEWATGGAIVNIKAGTQTKKDVMQSRALAHQLSSSATAISARTFSVNTTVGQPATVSNDMFAIISNDTSEVHEYYVGSDICVTLHSNMTECVYVQDIYELQPGGQVFESKAPTLDITFKEAGVYQVTAYSFFSGESSSIISNSSSTGLITVS